MLKILLPIIFVVFTSGASGQTAADGSQGPAKSSLMNPAISVNALTLYRRSKQQWTYEKPILDNGFALQEVEAQFLADVDPYLRASVVLSLSPNPPAPNTPAYGIEPEEAFMETTSLPYVTLKAGRFQAAIGKHNMLHTHAFPFIDAPLINQELLGDDGYKDEGLSASVLVPGLPWFMELTVQGLRGKSETLFNSTDSDATVYVERLRNLRDLTDAMTLDFGLSAAYGRNAFDDRTTVQGADLTLKWRPHVGGKYQALILGGEVLEGRVRGKPANPDLSGYTIYAQYQFAERWWIQARSEEAGNTQSGAKRKKASALLAFFPSEFSGFRLEYDRTVDPQNKARDTYSLQGNFTIGAHPAHAY